MEIEAKASIIEEFIRDFVLHAPQIPQDIVEFMTYNDVGIPLAQCVTYGLATATDEGEIVIEETWRGLCQMVDADPDKDYDDLDDVFLQSGGE